MSNIESKRLVAVITRTKDRPLFLERPAQSVLVGRPETRRRKLGSQNAWSHDDTRPRVSGVEFAGSPLGQHFSDFVWVICQRRWRSWPR